MLIVVQQDMANFNSASFTTLKLHNQLVFNQSELLIDHEKHSMRNFDREKLSKFSTKFLERQRMGKCLLNGLRCNTLRRILRIKVANSFAIVKVAIFERYLGLIVVRVDQTARFRHDKKPFNSHFHSEQFLCVSQTFSFFNFSTLQAQIFSLFAQKWENDKNFQIFTRKC